MIDARPRSLDAPAREVWLPNIRGGMWFRPQAGRLLSAQEFTLEMSAAISYTGGTTLYRPLPHDCRVFLTAVDYAFYHGGTGVWTVNVTVALWDASSYAVVASRSNSGLTAGRWYGYTDPINVEVDTTKGNSGTNPQALGADFIENSGTAGFYPLTQVRYRLMAN